MEPDTEYWLVPGMETIFGDIPVKALPPATNTVGTWASQISNYQKGGATQWLQNTPRSMAIAYKKIDIDGAAIHLTEIRAEKASQAALPVNHAVNGWSQDADVKVYGFCGIDEEGNPNTVIPGFNITPFEIPGVPTPGGGGANAGLCDCVSFQTPFPIGCDVVDAAPGTHIFLAATVSLKNAPPDPADYPGVHSWTILSRTISVTIHGKTADIAGINILS